METRKQNEKQNGWDALTDAQLRDGVRLCVERQDLLQRDVAIALLEAMNLTPEDVKSVVDAGMSLVEETGGEPIFF